MRLKYIIIFFLLMTSFSVFSQNKIEFKAEASANVNYSPSNDLDVFIGARYIPEASYKLLLNESNSLDFEFSVNMYASSLFHPFNSDESKVRLKPYRVWARYSGEQYELRIGLQKLNFGSASILRPLQWFDEMDPRDPLKFTTGVYGLMGRYYFSNNANIWTWFLYANENPRGFEMLKNNKDIPEYGGRIQLPVPRGEIAATYHHRVADSRDISFVSPYDEISEDRYAIDGKWDLEVGLWFEASHIHKSKNIGRLTNQTYLNIGMDYTFALGNGLNVMGEHLITSMNEKALSFEKKYNMSASRLSYPIGLFDTISTMTYYSWDNNDLTFFLNYQHQFDDLTTYVMAYYNPDSQLINTDNINTNTFSGFGIRLMFVYNH